MTDLSPAAVQPRTPQRLTEWATEARAAHDLATALCDTSFAPAVYRNKPMEATAAILAGYELGLSPMAALNAFDPIQGRPAPKAITLRAVVLAAGHDLWVESATDREVVVQGRRAGSQRVQESRWTWARAQKLGLTGKKQWQEQPQAMLTARATSECARLVGADALLGIPYSAEELADGVVHTVSVQRADDKTTGSRRVERKPAAVDAPPVGETPADAPDPQVTATATTSSDDSEPEGWKK